MTGRQLDYLAEAWRPWLLLTLLALALFLPGIVALPPVDRDEARFVQATRQMLESGDFVRIRFQDEARNRKPVGIYWLQAAAVEALGTASGRAIWPYRLVSVAGGVAATLLLFAFGAAIFDRRTALVAAAFLACSLDLVVEAHLATTDAVLLALAILVQGVLGLAYLGARRGERVPIGLAAAFWLAIGAALLVKGPVVPGLALVTALCLVVIDRRARWLLALRPIWGVPLALAIVLPWLMLIERATDGAFLRDSVGRDFIGKLAGGQEAHGLPPGYYFALLPVSFWPASLFLAPAALWLWRGRRLPAARLLAAWILPFWLLLECVPTKLPHYVLPLYPALALAAARGVVAVSEEGLAQPRRWQRVIFPALWLVAGLALGAALLGLPILLDEPPGPAGAVALVSVLVLGWHVLWRERSILGLASVPVVPLAALLVLVPGFGLALPVLDPIWLSRSAARLVAETAAPDAIVAAAGYAEPSLVFLLGTGTRLVPGEQAAELLSGGQAGLALVADDQDARFRRALDSAGARPFLLGAVEGFDYSNGKWLELNLYRLADGAGK